MTNWRHALYKLFFFFLRHTKQRNKNVNLHRLNTYAPYECSGLLLLDNEKVLYRITVLFQNNHKIFYCSNLLFIFVLNIFSLIFLINFCHLIFIATRLNRNTVRLKNSIEC